ncbi:Very-long-chain (3R)-3-hydroxyacyl-CoA dehydratase [Rhynchospora pubera]|uniref:Very-long-chain (3R)-3-hydroxyacyl-CoA dehydratase n=1 Tax=Rhynchospora pubera TaxID=906938 RepID=A0AAV8ENA3_9POAL|nr:Very-long-chain (3R)-3-hydroxyacyl-CoA dehydratase [Rhynchospora pubera]
MEVFGNQIREGLFRFFLQTSNSLHILKSGQVFEPDMAGTTEGLYDYCWLADVIVLSGFRASTGQQDELIGLVRSPVSATLPQIGSRLFVTWGILHSFPETRTHILVSSLVISWFLTEIIRYSFFGMKEALGFTPSWLRYSTFLLLYPTGITSEVGLIYIALPYIKASDKFCFRMPNKWNFSFDYYFASLAVLGIYVPGSPHMYTYMLGKGRRLSPS